MSVARSYISKSKALGLVLGFTILSMLGFVTEVEGKMTLPTYNIYFIEPDAGPIEGDTRVLVHGSGFDQYNETYTTPRCRFGGVNQTVPAEYVACTNKSLSAGENEKFGVNKNMTCLQCENAPNSPSGDAEIVSFSLSITGNFDDVVQTMNYEYYPHTQIYAIYPRYGPKDGETRVQVWGNNFIDFGENTRCAFGTKTVKADVYNSTYMVCYSSQSDVVQKPIPFTISLNNQQNSPDTIMYWYYAWPQVSQLLPNRGPETGNTGIVVKGKNFHPFHVDQGDIDNSNDTFCAFTKLDVRVPATVINSTKVLCYSPPSYYYRDTPVEVTLNGIQYTDDDVLFHYYKPPFLFDITPGEGPLKGGTEVVVTGSNFEDTGTITCKFGTKEVPGTYLSASEILCVSPAQDTPGTYDLSITLRPDTYSSPIDFLYYNEPDISYIEPACGPVEGFTQIAVYGSNFLDLKGNKAFCVFNKTIYTNATIFSETLMYCDSPVFLNKKQYTILTPDMNFYDLQITIDAGLYISKTAVEFHYYIQPVLSGITPDSGPKKGGTAVSLYGQHFDQYGVCNVTVRFETMVVYPQSYNDTAIQMKAPAATLADAVSVEVALNGQQYTIVPYIHKQMTQNTYHYYDDPVAYHYWPDVGPSIGNTSISIEGYGFAWRKPQPTYSGQSVSQVMWARFVDPSSQTALSPATQIKSSYLQEDHLTWFTPAQPANTEALMQISPNNQDWINIIPQNASYSFMYYQAPAISSVNPSFGPVKSNSDVTLTITGTDFNCPDTACSKLMVRFGDEPNAIYMKGNKTSSTTIQTFAPKYTKPDVLKVEITMNGQDYTANNHTYGYFDPYVLSASPRLLATDGSTIVTVNGLGFVNSGDTKSYISNSSRPFTCSGSNCTQAATYIDQHTMTTPTYSQASLLYNDNNGAVAFDPFHLDVSVYNDDYTENFIEVMFYSEPNYTKISATESPANIEQMIFINTTFHDSEIANIIKYADPKCRFKLDSSHIEYTTARIISYPFANDPTAKPNHIICKSPNWPLVSSSGDQVKFDVSVNGQNFAGNFDFKFTKNLILDRDIAMSGPLGGSSNTRMLGDGFTSQSLHVNTKWGVLGSDNINTQNVSSYDYTLSGFLGMYPGNDELKSYQYEAAHIRRVDSVLNDGDSIESYYEKSYALNNKSVTFGGPYYLEVGYKQNISYYDENNVVRNYTYYDFNPSYVEYYYYRQPTIVGINPTTGISTGGTPISIIGTQMEYFAEYGVVPHCKIGDVVVRAYWDSNERIVCNSPAHSTVGEKMSVYVSLNGIDWVDTGFKFSYYEEPSINDVFPDMGPVGGGTEVYLFGNKFTNMTGHKEFNCRFTPSNTKIKPKTMKAEYHNSSTVSCKTPGGWSEGDLMKLQLTMNGVDYDNNNFTFTFYSISSMFPKSGPSNGLGGDIIINGLGFRADTTPLCNINGTNYQPTSISWSKVTCPMPAAQSGSDFFGNVPFKFTANGNDWKKFDAGFQYYEQPIVQDIDPKQGPSQGVGIINFYGSGFRNDFPNLEIGCKIGDSVGVGVYISSRQVKCVVEDMQTIDSEDDYLYAQVSLNSYSWTEVIEDVTVYQPYAVNMISPTGGPTTGVTDVLVQGTGFIEVQGQTPRCRFGTSADFAIVTAEVLSFNTLVCRSPEGMENTPTSSYPLDVPFSIALTSDDFDPWTETYHKFRIYEQPLFDYSSPDSVKIGAVSEVFIYADEDSSFFEPVPSNTELDSFDEEYNLFAGFGGITCQFGRFGKTQGTYYNSTTISCLTPNVLDDPQEIFEESVTLSVAFNGVDFEDDDSDLEFTFKGTGASMGFLPFLLFIFLLAGLIAAFAVYAQAWFMPKPQVDDDMDQPDHYQ